MRKLLEEHPADVPGQLWHVRIGILHDFRQARHEPDARGRDMAELVEMRAQRVHRLGALFHELLPRVRNAMARACWSDVFGSTNRMVGRSAASTMASASAASFFCRLMNGLT